MNMRLVMARSSAQSLCYVSVWCHFFSKLRLIVMGLKVERIKGIFSTNNGWFIINGADGIINYDSYAPSTNSRIEIIAAKNHFQDISNELQLCTIKGDGI